MIAPAGCGAPVKVLFVNGLSNRTWQRVTPVLKKILEDAVITLP